MKKILLINGPNLNLLGVREPNVYGAQTYADLVAIATETAKNIGVELLVFQTNHEGAIVDKIQEALTLGVAGIVINPAAYTHTSVAILDALKAVNIPTVEVHISDISSREKFRQFSYVSLYAQKVIAGKGLKGYQEAIEHFA